MYGETFYSRRTYSTKKSYCHIEIGENRPLKATHHDKYENMLEVKFWPISFITYMYIFVRQIETT
jgi:hypothetical protein